MAAQTTDVSRSQGFATPAPAGQPSPAAQTAARAEQVQRSQLQPIGISGDTTLQERSVTDLGLPQEKEVPAHEIFNLEFPAFHTVVASRVGDRVLQSGISSAMMLDGLLLTQTTRIREYAFRDQIFTLWDLRQCSVVSSYQLPAPSFLSNNGHVYSFNANGDFCQFDAKNGKTLKTFWINERATSITKLNSGLFVFVTVSRWSWKIKVWDVVEGRCIDQKEDSTTEQGMKSIDEEIKALEYLKANRAFRSFEVNEKEAQLSHLLKRRSRFGKQITIEELSYGGVRALWPNDGSSGYETLSTVYGNSNPFILQHIPKTFLDDGQCITFEGDSLIVWQSKEQKLLTFLEKAGGKTLQLPTGLKNEEIELLLTLCEEKGIVKGFRLSAQEQTPLFRTRAYHLCPRPRLTLSEKKLVKIPDEFVCSITGEIMLDPVIAADGESYERTAIKGWLAQKQTSPKHHIPLEHPQIIPNRHLQRSIDAFLQEHPFLFEPDNGTEHSVYTVGILQEAKDLFSRKESNPLQRLIERHPQPMALPFEDGQTLLHLACSQTSDELLKAVLRGLGKYIVPILIHHSVETFFRMAVKAMGAEGGRIIATATFWKEADYLQECRAAIQRGDLEIVDACLQLGVSVDAVLDPKSGNALLHEAVAADQQSLAEFLVAYGADVKLRNGEKQTPEDLAYQLGRQHLVKAMHDAYMRKIAASQTGQTGFEPDRTSTLEAQNRRLTEQVLELQRQMKELMDQQKRGAGLSAQVSPLESELFDAKK